MTKLKYPIYHQDSNIDNVIKCIDSILPLYNMYSVKDIAEAHHQIRKELNLIEEVKIKRKKIEELESDLNETN